MGLTFEAAVIIALLVFLALFVVVDLALLPGKIAQRRGHPQSDMVTTSIKGGLLVWKALSE